MSAIIRRSRTSANLPYDSLYHKDDLEIGKSRKSIVSSEKTRNYFDKVNNPADGGISKH
jgi:methylmalonyl-CoA mutase